MDLREEKEIWDKRAPQYDQLGWVRDKGLLEWLTSRILGEMKELETEREAPGEAPLEVLDLGCGTGAWLPAFLKAGCKITAVDLSAQMIARARQGRKIGESQWVYLEPVDWVVSDWLEFKKQAFLDDRKWDVVISRMLLHHTPNAVDAIRAWAQLVRPGGLLAIAEGPPVVSNNDHASTHLYRAAFALKEPGRLILHTHDIVGAMHRVSLVETMAFERFSHGNSLEGWLEKTATDPMVADAIRLLHETASGEAKGAYRMAPGEGGIGLTMSWRHNLVLGWRGHNSRAMGR